MKHRKVVLVAVAGAAALRRAVHLVAEAAAHPAALLTATAHKADQAAGEVGRVQAKAEAVPDKNQVEDDRVLYKGIAGCRAVPSFHNF